MIRCLMLIVFLTLGQVMAEELRFSAVQEDATGVHQRPFSWKPEQTALIICDVWDYHHSLNAVRRLEEFAPRMNELVKLARQKGVTIIHAPSDCMAAYEKHPARKRAVEAPPAAKSPEQIKSWCSRIPTEEQANYPVDQSDGGDDDDPAEHKVWAEKLKKLGRNPNLPWQAQSAMIEIDNDRDYISDRGDEVWNILAARRIDNVMLVGVHVNMCVLGRPFGLRQMVRNGKNTVLVRDLTDAMYNPASWPYVDHFTGNALVIRHIERYVCPTTTSDQFLGGQPFRFRGDKLERSHSDLRPKSFNPELLTKTWQAVAVPNEWTRLTKEPVKVAWYRANVRLNSSFANSQVQLKLDSRASRAKAWLNGERLPEATNSANIFTLPAKAIQLDDANLLVIRLEGTEFLIPPQIVGANAVELKGNWEVRVGVEPTWSNIPLPAKFGLSTDIYHEP